MEKKQIPIVALAIFSMVILLANGNIQKAFALSTDFRDVEGAGATSGIYGYDSATQRLWTSTSDSTTFGHVFVSRADNLDHVQQVGNTSTWQVYDQTNYQSIHCDNTRCIFPANDGSNRLTMAYILKSSGALTLGGSSASYANCFDGEYLGGSFLISYGDACPNKGIILVSVGNIGNADVTTVLSTQYAKTLSSVGHKHACTIGSIMYVANPNLAGEIGRFNTATLAWESDLADQGGQITEMYCSATHIYIAIPADNLIRKITTGGATVWSNTVTTGTSVYVAGGTVYAGDVNSDYVLIDASSGADIAVITLASSGFPYAILGTFNSTAFNYWTTNENIGILNGVLTDTEDPDPVGSTACIDTNLNGAVDLCFTDTNGDGIADNGQSGALGAFNSNANVTQLGNQWFCAFNLGDACNNEDVTTNGVGLFYLGVIVIISYAFLVAIHIQAIKMINKEQVQVMNALNINPYLLLTMLVIDVGFAFYMGFVANEIFYTLIALIAIGLGFFAFTKIRGSDNA